MPMVLDETFFPAAYSTAGNGGRKLVNIGNTLYGIAVDTANSTLYIRKKVGNNPPEAVCFISGAQDMPAIATDGSKLYVLWNTTTKVYLNIIEPATVTNTDQNANKIEQDSLTSVQNGMTIDINFGVIAMAWSGVHPSYPNSKNVRTKQGTIANGSVTWGAVKQLSVLNTTGQDFKNPSIVVNSNNIPFVFTEYVSSGNNNIVVFTTAYTAKNFAAGGDSEWGNKSVYNGGSYAQSSPSAIFVPQSVNGLMNGRIWVAWSGQDATDTSSHNIRSSFSDDGGVTWSAMVKHTSGNTGGRLAPSITANKNNRIDILYANFADGDVYKLTNTSGTWSGGTKVTNTGLTNTYAYPSALFDLTMNVSEPLFIYKGNAKVGFYGTWVITNISVTPGNLGTKSDKNNLLTYNITTDGTMSDITEKINGTVVNTRTNPTSGQQFTVSLTQAQWDAIKYGKYKDAAGGLNTLTIEMGSDIWTYTFDKRLDANADVLSAVKAVQDSQQVYLPAVKALLGSAIRAKGGTVNDTDVWSAFVSAVGNMPVKKYTSGTITSPASGDFTISGLPFKPSRMTLYYSSPTSSRTYCVININFINGIPYYSGGIQRTNTFTSVWNNGALITYSDSTQLSNGVTIKAASNYVPSVAYEWEAFAD